MRGDLTIQERLEQIRTFGGDESATDERIKRLPVWARSYIRRLEDHYNQAMEWLTQQAALAQDNVPKDKPRIIVEGWDHVHQLPPLAVLDAAKDRVTLEFIQVHVNRDGVKYPMRHRVHFQLSNREGYTGILDEKDHPLWVEVTSDHGRILIMPASSNRLEFKLVD